MLVDREQDLGYVSPSLHWKSTDPRILSTDQPTCRVLGDTRRGQTPGPGQDLTDALATVTLEDGPTPAVNRLPPKVLARILAFRTFERTLVIATHVCRHWRSTILSVPTLWTNITCRDLDRTLTYLERSKDALIEVCATSSSSNFQMRDILSRYIERTRLLRVNLSRADVRSAVLQLRDPVSSLEILELFGSMFDAPRINLPADFLGHHAPSLLSIHFSDVSPTFTPFYLPNLTHFYLRGTDEPTPMDSIFGLFKNAPRLREAFIFCRSIIPSTIPFHEITLEFLERFTFRIYEPIPILRFLRLPSIKQVCVELQFHPEKMNTFTHFLPIEVGPLLADVTSISCTVEPSYGCLVINVPDLEAAVYALSPNGVDPAVILPALLGDKSFFPLSKIKKLEFTQHEVSNPFPLAEFENLEILELDDCWEELIFSVLQPSVDHIPCPHLRELTIRPSEDRDFPLMPLVQLAKARKEAGCAFKLTMDPEPENMSEEVIAMLEEYVEELDFA
ncbi:hypothetical protein BJ322DRAFT_506835 [Thelephora terrestris]|uniref:F-box domain-containing protein n=1 Tax=Thelephora terrestris TaxID=56493 RepID=A0A9P6H3Q0_9AGAM|nr:hypothetical protein BJ322DRAFT_506835 [Thelephora terrestris]